MATTLVVADACVLINLSATQMLPAIVEAAEVRLGVVQPEVWDEVSGGFGAGASRVKVLVDLVQQQSDGLVEPLIMTADELVGFVALAGDNLDDGEAASLSVAISRNLDIASDDRAVGRVIASRGLGVVPPRADPNRAWWLDLRRKYP